MKIYTKTGDDGSTGLLGKGRLRKDDPRIESYGSVDELNAMIGVALSGGELPDGLSAKLTAIQNDLFAVGSALADPNPEGKFFRAIDSASIARLEGWIDEYEAALPALTQFIVPGGSPAASCLHLARTICRRAERRVVELVDTPGAEVAPEVLVYLNRLSDLLFVMARSANHAAGRDDIPWKGLTP
jgi:cob(I)alamin adenosyltransferase